LANAVDRDLFLRVLEEVRERHDFVVVGYVVMPEHIHLLMSEPEVGSPSLVMAGAEAAHGAGPTAPTASPQCETTRTVWRCAEARILAGSFLRLQCVERKETS
jgi:REP element-mobilizing transposase RayT